MCVCVFVCVCVCVCVFMCVRISACVCVHTLACYIILFRFWKWRGCLFCIHYRFSSLLHNRKIVSLFYLFQTLIRSYPGRLLRTVMCCFRCTQKYPGKQSDARLEGTLAGVWGEIHTTKNVHLLYLHFNEGVGGAFGKLPKIARSNRIKHSSSIKPRAYPYRTRHHNIYHVSSSTHFLHLLLLC